MLAIHGIWLHGLLSLWAEDSDEAALTRPPGATRTHPFAARAGLIADVIAEFSESAGDLSRKAVDDEVTLWLPTTATGPVPSPDLVIEETPTNTPSTPTPARSSRVRLAPWRVPALTFEPAAALDVLEELRGPDTPPERGVVSSSVHFLAALGALAFDLAARGRVLPGAAETRDLDEGAGPAYFARWRPVLAGADALRARELTVALPPLCRASSAAGEPSAAIVTEALDSLTDAAVRARLSATPGFRLLEADHQAQLTDRWAAALTGPDGQFSVTTAEVAKAAQLAFALWTWQDAAQEPPGPVRTCFRLVEPPARRRASNRVEYTKHRVRLAG